MDVFVNESLSRIFFSKWPPVTVNILYFLVHAIDGFGGGGYRRNTHYPLPFWIHLPYLTMRCAKRRTAPMVLCNCQLEATPSARNRASTCTSDILHLPSWKAPCDRLRVVLERSISVLRAQSPVVSTQPRLQFAIPCRWRQLATHMHSPHLSCVLMGSLKKFHAGKVISPVRCGCCLHPWYMVPWAKACLPQRETSTILPPALSYDKLLSPRCFERLDV